MSQEKSDINLDDVFKHIQPYTAPVTATAAPAPAVAPVARARAPTVQSVASSVSTASTIRTTTKPAQAHVPPPPRPITNVPQDMTVSTTSLLNKVFQAVELPPVNGPRLADPTKELDDILADHDEPAYYAPSKNSSLISQKNEKPMSVSGHYASEAHPQYPGSVVGKKHEQHDHNENYDSFDQHHQVPRLHDSVRSRTNTIDSSVSRAETRLGGFDFHDNLGNPANWQNEVSHSEIAQVDFANQFARRSSTTSTIQRAKLNDLQKEVTEAKNKQSLLQQKVHHETEQVERLRQKTFAQEATHKANQFASRKEDWVSKSNNHYVPPPPPPPPQPIAQKKVEVAKKPELRVNNVPKKIEPTHVVYPKTQPIKKSQSSIYYEEPTRITPVANYQLAHGEQISAIDGIALVIPQYEIVQNYSRNNRINKVVIGGEAEPSDDDKTILLFGPAKSGKTSLINSILNYVYDVKKENNFRFVLDEEVIPTTGLTAYTINNSILSYNITIVDTPGIVSNRKTKTVSTLVKQWFEGQLLRTNAFRLDAISIVLNHNENTLGWPFIYELAAIKKLFGDDVKTNVLPVITNSEVISQPLAVRSLHQANISFLDYYKVNNLGFAASAPTISKLNHNLFYTHGMASFDRFFTALQEHVHPLVAILRHKDGRSVQPAAQLKKAVLY